MLISLRILNFAIVSQLELDFSTGMTAFTGETGAGKSIMIDALTLALGGRADAGVVRPGEDTCDIQACFDIANDVSICNWLNQHDIAIHDGEIFLRRVIYSEGRSKSYINGIVFPLQKIKELSSLLVDIHGQHQHHSLLLHATHRQQLDAYAGHNDLLSAVEECYRQCQDTHKKLVKLQHQDASKEHVELLQYQINELTLLNLQAGEIETLNTEHQLLNHAKDYLYNSQQICTLLQHDDQPNVAELLYQIKILLEDLPQNHPLIKTCYELIDSAIINCDEALNEITTFSEQIQLDPLRLEELDQRISLLHQIARKYQVEVNQLPEYTEHLQHELQELLAKEQQQSKLEQLYQKQLQHFEHAAQALSQSRQQHALNLAQAITDTINRLGMPNGYLTIEITPLEKMQSHGLDRVEYKVCTNLGMEADSLSKVASGGELSRISLAIQLITAEHSATRTLLFDEVDVGIGGATAALVGQLLRQLGSRLQLFCVTHQPQVAACAHHHFVVEKHSEHEQTFSKVFAVHDHDKVDEIARMLGGLKITEQTRSHARELLMLST
ncbi:MAG: DNA repair protein RecN [Legionella sp.]